MNRFFKNKLAGNQQPLLIALLAVAIVLVVLVAINLFKDASPKSASVADNSQGTSLEEIDSQMPEEVVQITQPGGDVFRDEVPENIVVPEIDTELSEDQKREIALPTVVVPASPGVESKFRSFVITAENDTFSPLKIIANVGDTVNISFTAVDKDYDIIFPSYNMKQTAKVGQTRMLQFKARKEGNFTYYCSLCGGPESGPKGNIIIVAE